MSSSAESDHQQEILTLKGVIAEFQDELLKHKAITSKLQTQLDEQTALAANRLEQLNQLKELFKKERAFAKQEIIAGRNHIKDFHAKATSASKKWESMRYSMECNIKELTELVEVQMEEIEALSLNEHVIEEELKIYKDRLNNFDGKVEWMTVVNEWSVEKVNLKRQIDDLSLIAEERLLIIEEVATAAGNSMAAVDAVAHQPGSNAKQQQQIKEVIATIIDDSVFEYLLQNSHRSHQPQGASDKNNDNTGGVKRSDARNGNSNSSDSSSSSASSNRSNNHAVASNTAVVPKRRPKLRRKPNMTKPSVALAAKDSSIMKPIKEADEEDEEEEDEQEDDDDGEDESGEEDEEEDAAAVPSERSGWFW